MCPFAFCSQIATYLPNGHCDFCQMGTLSFLMGTAVFQMGTHVFQMGTHVFQMGTQSSLADPCFTRNGHTLVNIPPNGRNVLPKWAHMFPQRGTLFFPSGHHWAHGAKPSKNMFSENESVAHGAPHFRRTLDCIRLLCKPPIGLRITTRRYMISKR